MPKRKNVPGGRVELGAAYIRSGLAPDQAKAPRLFVNSKQMNTNIMNL